MTSTQVLLNPNKTKSIRELGKVNIDNLLPVIESLSQEVWDIDNNTKPNKFAVLNKTEHIVMKFVKELQDWTTSYNRPMWQILKKHIEPVLLEAVKPYEYEKGKFSRVMLAKLPAKQRIKIHADGSEKATFPHKIHVPLVTNKNTFFYVGKVKRHFKKGYAYEVNNKSKHYAINNGDSDRIHLIFEYYNSLLYL
jgi:hypothetical protein